MKLNQAALCEIPVVFPPANEQRRIVEKIEERFSELDKGGESLKTARAQLKVYRQAVLEHAFEGKLTADWRAANPDKIETADQLLATIQRNREARYQQQLDEWQSALGVWEIRVKKRKMPRRPRLYRGAGMRLIESTLSSMVESGLARAHGATRARTYTLSPEVYRRLGSEVEYTRQAGFDRQQQEQMVRTHVREHGRIRRQQVMDLCHLDAGQAYRLLSRLAAVGVLRLIGRKRGAYYERGENF